MIFNSEPNKLDNLQVNVKELYKEYPVSEKSKINLHKGDIKHFYTFQKIYKNRLLPLKFRNKLWYLFHITNLDQFWFYEFKNYWSKFLKGRTLFGIIDFYFFKNIFRLKFQTVEVSDTEKVESHIAAWQKNEVLYQLLHLVQRESSINKLATIKQVRKYINFKSFLEFGCGTAPITKTYLTFYKKSAKTKIYISDIQTIAFHFATQRFSNYKNITPILLKEENDLLLTDEIKTDVIFCVTVFEHLNKPLETIKKIYKILNNNGVLVFDYILSDGDGLDTMQGIRERNDVLKFIEKYFIVLFGKVDYDNSMGRTIIRKKTNVK